MSKNRGGCPLTYGMLFSRIASVLVLSLVYLFSFTACDNKETESSFITLATTTSVNDSGLLDVLKPVFEEETGIKIKVIAQGTGQAVKTGESGDADVLFIHDKKSEENFVSSGDGVKRIELMYNYFILVGPKEDPAGIKAQSEKNASKALIEIAKKECTFVSRGDDSGTHKKEMAIWKLGGMSPKGKWYASAGRGMGEVLMMANEKKAYTLTDKATYLSMKDKLELEIVLENAKDLKNQYSVIAVNPDKHKGINSKGANEFIEWITSKKALDIINEYGRESFGQSLFTVNYSEEK